MEWWLKHTGQVAHLPQDYSLIGLYLISTATDMPVLEQVQKSVNALSGLYLISTLSSTVERCTSKLPGVNALSGLYLISTMTEMIMKPFEIDVSMPSRAYTSFLPAGPKDCCEEFGIGCQCPLGLIPHFYETKLPKKAKASLCQCPLGLIPHFYRYVRS